MNCYSKTKIKAEKKGLIKLEKIYHQNLIKNPKSFD